MHTPTSRYAPQEQAQASPASTGVGSVARYPQVQPEAQQQQQQEQSQEERMAAALISARLAQAEQVGYGRGMASVSARTLQRGFAAAVWPCAYHGQLAAPSTAGACSPCADHLPPPGSQTPAADVPAVFPASAAQQHCPDDSPVCADGSRRWRGCCVGGPAAADPGHSGSPGGSVQVRCFPLTLWLLGQGRVTAVARFFGIPI